MPFLLQCEAPPPGRRSLRSHGFLNRLLSHPECLERRGGVGKVNASLSALFLSGVTCRFSARHVVARPS